MAGRKTLTEAIYALAEARGAIARFAKDIGQPMSPWLSQMTDMIHRMEDSLIETNKTHEREMQDQEPDIDEAQEWEDYDYATEIMEPMYGSDSFFNDDD